MNSLTNLSILRFVQKKEHPNQTRFYLLWINRTTLYYVGLFGVNTGSIDSLGITVSDKNIAGGCAGGLVGYSYDSALFNQCYVTGNGKLTASITGGLIGQNERGSITNCYATVTILSTANYAGGLVGSNGGNISNCYATGNVSCSTANQTSGSGGLIGNNNGNINNCYATGNSSAAASNSNSYSYYSYSGGLIGYNTGGISNCYATGNSSASTSSGNYTNSYSGGLIVLL